MTRRTLSASAIVSLLATFLISPAADAQVVSKTTVAGGVLQLGHFASLNPDCTSSGETVVRVTKAPAHGSIRMKYDKAFATFRNYQHCHARRVYGVTVEYWPEHGFLGADAVGLEVIYPGGKERKKKYNIAVR